jgi:hypothetical protein
VQANDLVLDRCPLTIGDTAENRCETCSFRATRTTRTCDPSWAGWGSDTSAGAQGEKVRGAINIEGFRDSKPLRQENFLLMKIIKCLLELGYR